MSDRGTLRIPTDKSILKLRDCGTQKGGSRLLINEPFDEFSREKMGDIYTLKGGPAAMSIAIVAFMCVSFVRDRKIWTTIGCLLINPIMAQAHQFEIGTVTQFRKVGIEKRSLFPASKRLSIGQFRTDNDQIISPESGQPVNVQHQWKCLFVYFLPNFKILRQDIDFANSITIFSGVPDILSRPPPRLEHLINSPKQM